MPSPFLCKIIPELDVYEDIVLTIERTDAAYGPRVITIPAATYGQLLVLGDGDTTYDALKVLEVLVKASDNVDDGWGTDEFDGFTAGLNGDHKSVLGMAITQTATITWSGGGNNAEELRDFLRYTGATTNIGFPGAVATYKPFASVYLELEAAGGDVEIEPHVSLMIANNGDGEVNDYGQSEFLPMIFTVEGHDYEAVDTTFWYLKELVVYHLAGGGVVRIYFDVTVTTERAEFTNPYGWERWWAPGEKWDPERLESDNITWHEKEITFRNPPSDV